MKLNKTETRIANFISKFIVIILAIIFNLLRLIAKLLYKLKKWIYRLAIFVCVIYTAGSALTMWVYAPRVTYAYTEHPTTQKEEIIDYIYQVFGNQADNAFKVLACENHSLNPNAKGMNKNGTSDVGIFQVNSIHGVPETYLKDWRTNVDVAYQIYKNSGWNAWSCVTMYNSLGRKDSVL